MPDTILSITGLSKHFGGLQAVNDFNLEVEKGSVHGLIGPNGAGKTTTFDLITGFDVPSKGDIHFSGKSIAGMKPHEICKLGITRTFQQAKPLFGMTILENIAVGGLNSHKRLKDALALSEEVMCFLGLEKYRDVLAENIPIGYRKVLEIAKCLATKPQLLLLDEGMAGLNPSEMQMVLGKIRNIQQQGITVLLIEHVMEAVMSVCDRTTVLNFGVKLCEGTPREVVSDARVIDAYLGEEIVE
jgi:branched-chain amino acid transport system ATP-binding protein